MTNLKRHWPEAFGFVIYGNGPSFIIDVTGNSVAEESGLRAGDQILQVYYSIKVSMHLQGQHVRNNFPVFWILAP